MRFWLGTHLEGWLWDERLAGVDLFVSRRRLADTKRPRPALTDWALDSGGFSELSMYGRWTITQEQYATEVAAWVATPGRLAWAAVCDWMCEPPVVVSVMIVEGLYGPDWLARYLAVKPKDRLRWVIDHGPVADRPTHQARVELHQRRTVESWRTLTRLDGSLPWMPVLQGWEYDDYWRHARMYAEAGLDLRTLPVVGVGSVCRRQHTGMAEDLMRDLGRAGIRPHGLGFKFQGLVRAASHMESADSLAWSYNARRNRNDPKLRLDPPCEHAECANCHRWALRWRDRLFTAIGKAGRKPARTDLFAGYD